MDAIARWRKSKSGRWCAILCLEDAPDVGSRISVANGSGEVAYRTVEGYGQPFISASGVEMVYAYLKFEPREEDE